MLKLLRKRPLTNQRGVASAELGGVFFLILVFAIQLIVEIASSTGMAYQLVADNNGGGTELISSSSSVLVDPSFSFTPPERGEEEGCEVEGRPLPRGEDCPSR